jgi:hypothetical protein
MLDHDEERQLAEIEARLRDEAPDLLELFEIIPDQTERLDRPERAPRSDVARHIAGRESFTRRTDPVSGTSHPVWKSVAAIVAAVVLTTLVTLTVGPDLGGLVAVIGLSAAGMYAYQVVRGCPGLRDRHDDA